MKTQIDWKNALQKLQNAENVLLENIDFQKEQVPFEIAKQFEKFGIKIPNWFIDDSFEVLQYDKQQNKLIIQVLTNRNVEYWDEIDEGIWVGYDENGFAVFVEIENPMEKLLALIKNESVNSYFSEMFTKKMVV